jgi:hypothetical protein
MRARRTADRTGTPLFWYNCLALFAHTALLLALLQGATIAPAISVVLLTACLMGDVYMGVLLSRRGRR